MAKSNSTNYNEGVSTRHLLICNWLMEYLDELDHPVPNWPDYWLERLAYAEVAIQSLLVALEANKDEDPWTIIDREYSKWDAYSEMNGRASWIFKCMRDEIGEVSQILQTL